MEFSSLVEGFLAKFGQLMDRKFAEHLGGGKEKAINGECGSDSSEGKGVESDAVVLPVNMRAEKEVEEETFDEFMEETVAQERLNQMEIRYSLSNLELFVKLEENSWDFEKNETCSYRQQLGYKNFESKLNARFATSAAKARTVAKEKRILIPRRSSATRRGLSKHRRRKNRWRPKLASSHLQMHTSGVCQPL